MTHVFFIFLLCASYTRTEVTEYSYVDTDFCPFDVRVLSLAIGRTDRLSPDHRKIPTILQLFFSLSACRNNNNTSLKTI